MKKSLFFIALFLAGFAVNAQYGYINQATGYTIPSTGVRNVSAIDSNVAWIASYDGSGAAGNRTDYSRTTNGGLNWTPGTTPAPASHNWSMIHAHNADTAWAMYYNAIVGTGGGIWFTGDGGTSWVKQDSINGDPVKKAFNASSFPDIVYFWDGLNGISIGDPNTVEFEIYTTNDAGNSWIPVDTANIPNPLSLEYAIVDHYAVVGDTFWFDTNKGRVYRSVDHGITWTVSNTGITVPANGAIDICFYNGSNGIARLYDGVAGTNIMKTTSDGGDSWVAATPTGNFFGSDVAHIPGTPSRLISTGAATGFIGTSFSDDGGLTWIDFEIAAQRTAIGAVDTNHIWVGGFNTDALTGGIFLYAYIPAVSCTDTNITTGITSVTDTLVCPGDTMFVTATGVFSPNEGSASGVSWLVSRIDISGTTNPQADTSIILVYNFDFPAPVNSTRRFINDGANIGSTFPYGVYFWTPVVFGNATVINIPPASLNDLTLDPSCTYVGTSIMVHVLGATDPLCGVGIPENNSKALSVTGNFNDGQNLNLIINSDKTEKATIRVFDITGRMVFENGYEITNGVNNETISAADFGSGIYIVQVETARAISVSKIVRQ